MVTALNGIKVLDLSRFISGPYCGMLLADMGAEVVKVEKKGGEDTRHVPPFYDNESLYTASLNRNKKAITLDYRHAKAKEILSDLISWADIIIENFRPGTMEKMGFGPEKIKEINKQAILVRCSGFGQTGPLKQRPGFDAIAQAMGGLMSMTGHEGEPPLLSGTYIVDYATGLHAAVGALSALNYVNQIGKGQVVDISLYESAVSMLVAALPTYDVNKSLPERVGSGDRYAAPVNAFQTKDGWIYLSAPNQGIWKKLCVLMDRKDLLEDPNLQVESQRVEKTEEVNQYVEEWVKKYKKNEIVKLLDQEGIPCAPVQNLDEIIRDEHLWERDQLIKVKQPNGKEATMSGVTIKLSETPGEVKLDAPSVGQHNEDFYVKELGMKKDEFLQLKEENLF